MTIRFIYAIDVATRDVLLERGYTQLCSNGAIWVFDNPSGVDPEIEGHQYALYNTITF